MVGCETCDKEFETQNLLDSHNFNVHDNTLTSHQKREQKKISTMETKIEERSVVDKQNKRGQLLMIAGLFVGVIVAGYFVFFVTPSTTGQSINIPDAASSQLHQSFGPEGAPQGFVHWHADVNVILCGEDVRLPEAGVGGLLGASHMHTHDAATNRGSMPNSDGNGVIHSEGIISQQLQQHTLASFMRQINVRSFSLTSIMQYSNGDTCPDGLEGTVKATVNDRQIDDFVNYIPKDGDLIVIEFN